MEPGGTWMDQTMTGLMRYRSAACSHTGRVRAHNEDAYLERPDIGPDTGLWVVADGMGGMTSGDVASQAVVQALAEMPAQATGSAYIAEITARLNQVNTDLQDLAHSRGTPTPIGTTVAGLLMFGAHFACFWAGDSRIYRWRGGELDRLTRDHSLVQDMVDSGLLAPELAESHPHASVIQRAVGVEPTLTLEFTHARVQPGDVYLLCSDGLTRMVGDEELEQQLGQRPLEAVCETLLQLVLQRGARDNVTMILVAA